MTISLRGSFLGADYPATGSILHAGSQLFAESALSHRLSPRLENSLMSPELLARTEELGVRLSVRGGREDLALEDGDAAPWQEALKTDAAVFWTTHPEQILALLNR
jgi:hypothetical protein